MVQQWIIFINMMSSGIIHIVRSDRDLFPCQVIFLCLYTLRISLSVHPQQIFWLLLYLGFVSNAECSTLNTPRILRVSKSCVNDPLSPCLHLFRSWTQSNLVQLQPRLEVTYSRRDFANITKGQSASTPTLPFAYFSVPFCN